MNERTALRIADALESIAESLLKLANPPKPNSYAVDDYPYDISDKYGRIIVPKGKIKIPSHDPKLDGGTA